MKRKVKSSRNEKGWVIQRMAGGIKLLLVKF